MFFFTQMPSSTTFLSRYASFTGTIMIVQAMVNKLVPHHLQTRIYSKLESLIGPKASQFTLTIEEYDGLDPNKLYHASEFYLRSKITPRVERLRVSKVSKQKDIALKMDKGEEIVDVFNGIQVTWKYISDKTVKLDPVDPHAATLKSEDRSFELKFYKRHKDVVLATYLPYVLNYAKILKQRKKVVKLHTAHAYCGGTDPWSSTNLNHPATFDTLAMDHKLKSEIIGDLERFLRRKEVYKKMGKAWKRGYLLYGPPGTGKSSLIAAIANYLKFDVYDLELGNVKHNGELRRILLASANRSILVIEDIDCSVELTNRQRDFGYGSNNKITLSGLLNFIDGLWSSCGDERIIIFTTNHKDQLDPALLRSGRMDKHIHMSYCTAQGFNILASNYLGILNKNNINYNLYSAIEDSIGKCRVTPAEVAEELMKTEESDIALVGLLEYLKRKRIEQDELKENEDGCQEPKRLKIETENVKPTILSA